MEIPLGRLPIPACDAWHAEHGVCYCQIELACSGAAFCRNDFTDDARFRD